MSSQLIRDVALDLFTQRGYEGASLANIAELVGIKKSSIYNHYQSKDDLFLKVFELCCQNELAVTKGFFDKHRGQDLFPLLCKFIERRLDDTEHSTQTIFLFRFIVFPPPHLVEPLHMLQKHYLAISQTTIQGAITNHPQLQHIEPAEVQKFGRAFLAILNGLCCEKFLGRTFDIQEQFEAIWYGFDRHIK